jgi:DNA polymerase-3 subunit gamma/tau
LFCGPRGVGKTTCARILAKTINCENISPDIEACNECGPCKSFNKSTTFNIYELDAASNNSVDDIRSLVEQVRIPPQDGKFKVYIIDEVHMLSTQAFNAFLKTLEEPPMYAKFILATTEKHKIIPTILSRCQIFDFQRIKPEDIAKHLAYVANNEGVTYEEDALHIIAQKADGALRDALTIFDQLVSFTGKSINYQNIIDYLNVLDYDYYFRITEFMLNADIPNTLITINEILDKGFDGKHFILGLGEHLRNLLVCKDPETVKLLEAGSNIKNKYLDQSKKCDQKFLLKALDISNRADINYKDSNNKTLHLEIALMQISSIGRLLSEPDEKKKELIPPPAINTQNKKTKNSPSIKKEKDSVGKKEDKQKSSAQKKKATPGTLSIKDITTEIEDQKVSDNLEKKKELIADPFTQEKLEEIWSEYIDQINEQSPSFSNSIGKYKPLLKENFTIEIKTDNVIFSSSNENFKSLVSYLKEKLNNYRIHVNIVINKNNKEKKPYTDKEKFDVMSKMNPAMKSLKEKLDLEIEF